MFITVISFVIVIGIVVFVHEFGHYYAAIKCGVKVENFSLGFGKVIWSRSDSRGTQWQLRIIPIGGFVKMYGDQNVFSQQDNNLAHNIVTEDTYSFHGQSILKRAIIVAAGPMANYIFATLAFALVYYVIGVADAIPVIGSVIDDTPAFYSGLKVGDEILEVDGNKVTQFNDIRSIISLKANQKITLLVNRTDKLVDIEVVPALSPQGVGVIGIMPQAIERRSISILESIKLSVFDALYISKLTCVAIWEMISGSRSSEQLGGVISIARESSQSMSNGVADFVLFLAFISINIGMMNLLPLPVIDGGHLVLLAYEAISKQPASATFQRAYYQIGVVIIIFLIIISTLNDIKSLVS